MDGATQTASHQYFLPVWSLYSTVALHTHVDTEVMVDLLQRRNWSLQPAPFLFPRMTFSFKQVALPTSPLMTAHPVSVPQQIFTCIYVFFFSFHLHSFIVLLTVRFVLRGSMVPAETGLLTGNVCRVEEWEQSVMIWVRLSMLHILLWLFSWSLQKYLFKIFVLRLQMHEHTEVLVLR